jgi:hypothetical protein
MCAQCMQIVHRIQTGCRDKYAQCRQIVHRIQTSCRDKHAPGTGNWKDWSAYGGFSFQAQLSMPVEKGLMYSDCCIYHHRRYL